MRLPQDIKDLQSEFAGLTSMVDLHVGDANMRLYNKKINDSMFKFTLPNE